MNFGPQHYVPVLKVKRGEKAALTLLSDSVCEKTIPLLEIVELDASKLKSLDSHIDTSFEGLFKSVQRFSRVLLDARELKVWGRDAARKVFERASKDKINFTPVTGVSRVFDADEAISFGQNGIALRLTVEDFESGNLSTLIGHFLNRYKLNRDRVDLIVDLGAIDHLVPAGLQTLLQMFLDEVPNHNDWRTIIVSGCSFPQSMGVIKSSTHIEIENLEWSTWRDVLFLNQQKIIRLPTYSDCAIQHPRGVEGFDFRIMQASAAIRYYLGNSWLLIKGQGVRRILPSIQFPKLAHELVYGQFSSRFMGEAHCLGCELMKKSADGGKKLGSPEVWRKLGTVHHITSIVKSIQTLT